MAQFSFGLLFSFPLSDFCDIRNGNGSVDLERLISPEARKANSSKAFLTNCRSLDCSAYWGKMKSCLTREFLRFSSKRRFGIKSFKEDMEETKLMIISITFSNFDQK